MKQEKMVVLCVPFLMSYLRYFANFLRMSQKFKVFKLQCHNKAFIATWEDGCSHKSYMYKGHCFTSF